MVFALMIRVFYWSKIRAFEICWSLDRNEYEIPLLPVRENLVFDTSYLKLSCDQLITSWYEKFTHNMTHIMQLSTCVETNVSVYY